MRGCGGAWRARADEDRRDRYDFWRSVSLRARTATDVPRAVPATRESRGHDRRSLVWTSLTSPSDAARTTRAIRRSEQRTRHCTAIRRRMGTDSVIEAQLLLTLWTRYPPSEISRRFHRFVQEVITIRVRVSLTVDKHPVRS